MYCRAIATDFDGTAAEDGRIASAALGVLEAARDQGLAILLVTGRVLEDIERLCGDLSIFDAVVAENGAVVHLPAAQRSVVLGAAPPPRLLDALFAARIPFHTGAVVVGTWDRHAEAVLAIARETAPDHYLAFNRGALMLLPSGINKSFGVRRALAELGRSCRNMIALGDAENDLSLFDVAELAVAAKGADARITGYADTALRRSGGAGVAEFVRYVLDHGCVLPTPARHTIEVGRTDGGSAVRIPANGGNALVLGDPHSGKSFLTGLIAEQLLDKGYRLCVIDPEGDHAVIGVRPDVLAAGHGVPLPAPAKVPMMMSDQPLSLVLNLASLARAERSSYVDDLLQRLAEFRAESGLPHWIIVDEAHDYFGNGAAACRLLDSELGNMCLATYRPRRLDAAVFDRTDLFFMMRIAAEEDRYFATGLLAARGPRHPPSFEALDALTDRRIGLLETDSGDGARWRTFTATRRLTAHTHHARKYADALLPHDKAFYFTESGGDACLAVARNVAEFQRALRTVPEPAFRRHLAAGDFSRWVGGVLGNSDLADELAVVERAVAEGAPALRRDVAALMERYYGVF